MSFTMWQTILKILFARLILLLIIGGFYCCLTGGYAFAQSAAKAEQLCAETNTYLHEAEATLRSRRSDLRHLLIGRRHPSLGIGETLTQQDVDAWFEKSIDDLANSLRLIQRDVNIIRAGSGDPAKVVSLCFDMRSKAVNHIWNTQVSAAGHVLAVSNLESGSTGSGEEAAVLNDPRLKKLKERLSVELQTWSAEAKTIGQGLWAVNFNSQRLGLFGEGEAEHETTPSTPRAKPSSSQQVLLQYHQQNITISGENIPRPISPTPGSPGNVSFSDPDVRLEEVVSASAEEVVLRVYAGPKVGRKSVDVNIGSFTAKEALLVQRIDGAIWLVERLAPVIDERTSQMLFEFDLSLQILTKRTEENNDPKDSQSIAGARVAFGASGDDARVVAVSQSLDGLDEYQASWLSTNDHGRIYCRVRARVDSRPPFIEARFGDGLESDITGQNLTRPFRYASWSNKPDPQEAFARNHSPLLTHASWRSQPNTKERDNETAFNSLRRDGPIPKPLNDLLKRVFENGLAYELAVQSNFCVEQIATNLDQAVRLVFVATVISGMAKDPAYKGIHAAVRQFNSGASEKEHEKMARAIYGGFLLGATEGALLGIKAQTIDQITDLKEVAQWVYTYVKNNPRRIVREGIKKHLMVFPPAAINVEITELLVVKGRNLPGVSWIYGLAFDEKERKAIEKGETGSGLPITIDPRDFPFFMLQTYPYIYLGIEYVSDAKIQRAVNELALQAALFALETADALVLPSFKEAGAPYAKALGIDPKQDSVLFLQFTTGYFGSFVFGYAAAFISLEVLYAVATDGVVTYVKGLRALQKAGKALGWTNDVVGLLSVMKTFQELLAEDNASQGRSDPKPRSGALLLHHPHAEDWAMKYANATQPPRFTPAVYRVGPSSPPAGISIKAAQRLLGTFKIVSELDSSEKVAKFVKTLVDSKEKTLPDGRIKRITPEVLREMLSDFTPTELKGVGKLKFVDRAKEMAKAINKLPEDQVDEYMEGMFALLLLDRTEVERGIKEVAQHLVDVLPGQKSDDLADVLMKARELARDNPERLKGIYEEARSWAPFGDAEIKRLVEKLTGRSTTLSDLSQIEARIKEGIEALKGRIDDLRASVRRLNQEYERLVVEANQAASNRQARNLRDKAKAKIDEKNRALEEIRAISKDVDKKNLELKQTRLRLDPKPRAKLPCFSPNTPVLTPFGPIPFYQLKPGDLVLAYDFDTRAVISRKIVEVLKNRTQHYYEIAAQGEVIQATGNHPFWVQGESRWLPARDLRAGMILLSFDAKTVVVESVALREELESASYNLDVEGVSNYFVGPGVLVQNQDTVDVGLGGEFVVYRGTNPNFQGKVYIGQTTLRDASGFERGVAARQAEHRARALEMLEKERKGMLVLSDPDREFYRFMSGIVLEEKVRGLRTSAQAKYIEQLNMDLEREANPRALMNRREEIADPKTRREIEEMIRSDPDVTKAGYCPKK